MRLVAFGCSTTYGKGLSDQLRLTAAWPSILADNLNLPHLNKGLSGASNYDISQNILAFLRTQYEPGDVFIICVTGIIRYSNYFEPKDKFPSNVLYQTSVDSINETHLLLESKNIPHVFIESHVESKKIFSAQVQEKFLFKDVECGATLYNMIFPSKYFGKNVELGNSDSITFYLKDKHPEHILECTHPSELGHLAIGNFLTPHIKRYFQI